MPSPPRNSRIVLTPNVVAAMRVEYATGQVTQRQLAMRYGVEPMTISEALRGVTWRDVEPRLANPPFRPGRRAGRSYPD